MSDNKDQRGPQDRARINVNEQYELQYWSEKFGVSAEQLRAAVEKVGVSASAVETELGSSRRGNSSDR
ncbi:MAG: DUF3606 domain-containing protein [Bacteroidota bacterium]